VLVEAAELPRKPVCRFSRTTNSIEQNMEFGRLFFDEELQVQFSSWRMKRDPVAAWSSSEAATNSVTRI
jgi:hypothetical protein